MRLKKDIYLEDEVAHIDQLGYQPYVNAISNAILNDELKTPFVIGIYGQWGSGKSTLMSLIKDKIGKTKKQTIFSIWFKPWQYQDQNNLLMPLFLSLLEEVKASPTMKARLADINKKMAKIFSVTAESLLEMLAKPLVGVSKIKEKGEKIEAQHDITKSDYFKEILFINRLKNDFEQLVTYLVDVEGKLVIFIDDLDRCPPEKVIEMLESIKLFIGVKRCIFIVGINYDIVSLCVKNKYRDYVGKTGKFSDTDVEEYLEKLIQLPFRIPALQPKSLEKFINEVEKDPEINNLKSFFAKFLPMNPRKVKKVLNIFRLMIKLAKYSHLLSSPKRKSGIILELLAKILIIRERWLTLYTQFENNPDLLKQYEQDPQNTIGKLFGIKNRDDLIQIFKAGSHKFEQQKNLQQYFTLSEATTVLERKEEQEIVRTEGEGAQPDSGLAAQVEVKNKPKQE